MSIPWVWLGRTGQCRLRPLRLRPRQTHGIVSFSSSMMQSLEVISMQVDKTITILWRIVTLHCKESRSFKTWWSILGPMHLGSMGSQVPWGSGGTHKTQIQGSRNRPSSFKWPGLFATQCHNVSKYGNYFVQMLLHSEGTVILHCRF